MDETELRQKIKQTYGQAARGAMSEEVRRNMELWMGCLAGAMEEREYRAGLAGVGFEAIAIEPTRIYSAADARRMLVGAASGADGSDIGRIAALAGGKFTSAFVRARKPAGAP